jgi:acetolactate synthase-1/2/3 large subunit
MFDDDVLIISDPSDDTPGGVYVYDESEIEIIDRVSTAGIALIPGEQLLRLPRSLDESGSSGELLVYDHRGVYRYQRLDGLADAHGIAWQDGLAVVASTATNEIVWLGDTGVVRRWRAGGSGDAWHLNDVLVHRGRLYVGAFGRFSEHRDWSGRTAGAGIVFDLKRGRTRTVLDGLSAPHSQLLVNDHWLVCNSGTRELLELDESGRQIERRLELRVWPRGMVVRDRLLYVGESEHRYENTDAAARATIAVVDLDAWRVLDRIELPGREVYDLVFAPRAIADGLATGFRTNTARVRTTAQLGLFEEVGVEPVQLWAVGEPLLPVDRRARIDADTPERLPEQSEVDIVVALENLGSAIFVSAPPCPVYLSYRWYLDGDSSPIAEEPVMSPLPHALPPRTPMHCSLRVQTPGAGRYRLRLTLVQVHVAWFDEIDLASVADATVEVVAGRR